MKNRILILLLCVGVLSFSQEAKFTEKEIAISDQVDGTLLLPESKTPSLAIIIAGSGPTDRDGNQNFLKSNSLKKLAEGLVQNGIASFRYDKRIVKQIRNNDVDPNMMFDDFVTDAIAVVNYFKKSDAFNKVYVIGHSQGSLVGMLAAKDRADGFISLAGAGQNIGDVIVEQVGQTAPQFKDGAEKAIAVLKSGQTTDDFPPMLTSLFNKGIQPFMINWMSYEPALLIKELSVPILLVNGTKDLQVSVEEAKLLKQANDKAELKIIDKMNHVLFIIEGDKLENSKSYNEAFRPIASELLTSVVNFIKG